MRNLTQTKQGNVIGETRASLLRLSLEIAAKRFREDAAELRSTGQAGREAYSRLIDQFERQATEADELLAFFCEGDRVRVEFIA